MNEQVRTQTEEAVALLRQGKLPEAALAFQRAVRLAPDDVTLRQRLGDVYLRQGLRGPAIREFQQVAGRHAAEGSLLKAIALCKVILELDPEHGETLHALAELYSAQHQGAPRASALPASMSAALDARPRGNEAAETQPELDPLSLNDAVAPLDLESLSLFRAALAAAPAQPAGPAAFSDEEARETQYAPPIDLGRVPRSPLFSRLSKDAFEAVVQRLELRWISAGETLLREGEQGDSMFVLVQGVVNVLHGEKLIAVMAEGSFFGEMALLHDAPRLATVVAARDGLVFEIHRGRLVEIAARFPQIREVLEAFHRDRLLSNVLRVSPVFRPLSQPEREALASRFERHSLPPQAVILAQGKPGAGLCVLLRGRCEVFHLGGHGDELALPELKEGDVFGEISLLLDGPCTATVRTKTFCEVLELSRDDFRKLVLPNAAVKRMVQRLMAERIQRTADLLDREAGILADYIV